MIKNVSNEVKKQAAAMGNPLPPKQGKARVINFKLSNSGKVKVIGRSYL